MAQRVWPNTAAKMLGEDGRIGGYLVVWGDPSRPDLQGEFFTPETDLGLDWYPRRLCSITMGWTGRLARR